MKSEASVAKLAGLEGCVEHCVQPGGTGSSQGQLPPWMGQSPARWSGRGGKESQACGQEPHSEGGKWVQYVCVLGTSVSIPPIMPVWSPGSSPQPPPNVDRPLLQDRAPDPFYNLSRFKSLIIFSENLSKRCPLKEKKTRLDWIPLQSREIFKSLRNNSFLSTFIYVTLPIIYSIFLQNYPTQKNKTISTVIYTPKWLLFNLFAL